MNQEEIVILRKSLAEWGARTLEPLREELEHYHQSSRFPAHLFAELEKLDILAFRYNADNRADLLTLAEIVFAIAQFDPGIALLVLQQNFAAELLSLAGRKKPDGWIALPLFDHPLEWPYLLQECQSATAKSCINGQWNMIPGLPIAKEVLLPLKDNQGNLQLVSISRHSVNSKKGLAFTAPVLTLGMRSCPIADLIFENYELSAKQVLLKGQAFQRLSVLWSQGEIFALAIRSAILNRSYTTALHYAQERYQGGKIIIGHSLVRQLLAEMHLGNERLLWDWRDLCRHVNPDQTLPTALLDKVLRSSRELPEWTSTGMQLFGGYGYMEDIGQERWFRDAKQCEFLFGNPQSKLFTAFNTAISI